MMQFSQHLDAFSRTSAVGVYTSLNEMRDAITVQGEQMRDAVERAGQSGKDQVKRFETALMNESRLQGGNVKKELDGLCTALRAELSQNRENLRALKEQTQALIDRSAARDEDFEVALSQIATKQIAVSTNISTGFRDLDSLVSTVESNFAGLKEQQQTYQEFADFAHGLGEKIDASHSELIDTLQEVLDSLGAVSDRPATRERGAAKTAVLPEQVKSIVLALWGLRPKLREFAFHDLANNIEHQLNGFAVSDVVSIADSKTTMSRTLGDLDSAVTTRSVSRPSSAMTAGRPVSARPLKSRPVTPRGPSRQHKLYDVP
mmetsp:Transcript_66756/g.152968  ORF Transcript_66756/g.152968 Transcript_66756/m.152968 type:complete len:318 (-) Transcript_66756:241-1194(-)